MMVSYWWFIALCRIPVGQGRYFSHKFSGEDRRNPAGIAVGIELNNVSANDGGGLAGKYGQHFAERQSAGFGMWDAGGFGRVNPIYIKADIQWAFEHRHAFGGEAWHGNDFHAEAIGLFAAMAGECADADLDESLCQSGMAAGVALEIAIKIGVRVEVEDWDGAVLRVDRLHDGKGNRVVPAKEEGDGASLQCRGDACADQRVVVIAFGKREIALIIKCEVNAHFAAIFARHIPAITE
jgi:hypothetical protein